MGWFTSKQARLNQKLRSACSAGKLRDILLLLAEGADINAKDSEGAAPLVYAISTRRSEAVELLIAKGADVGINKVGKTPLMFACASGDPKIVGLLLETGTDVNAKNPGCYGWTALHYAAANGGNESIICLLVQKGADINARDTDDGETALHCAAYRGQFPAARALVANGADINLRDNAGNRAEESARRNGKNGVANFLQEKTAPVVALSTGWKLTAPDEIAFTAEKAAAGYCLTEIFNFNSRTYTQIARNLKTNAESQTLRFFDEFPDKKILEQAHQQLLKQGGKADSAVIYSSVLNKK